MNTSEDKDMARLLADCYRAETSAFIKAEAKAVEIAERLCREATEEQAGRRPGDITVKKFGDRYKLTLQKTAGRGTHVPSLFREAPAAPNEGKLANSVSRTRATVYELALCNPWEHFVTLTLDGEKQDRYDLHGWRKRFVQFLRNYQRVHGFELRYLLLPEQHKDGAWHMHGLFHGLPPGELVKNEYGYLTWPAYAKRFGFFSVSAVKSAERVSAYVTKYITKDVAVRNAELGAHLYYASNFLLRAETLGVWRTRGRAEPAWAFENEWVKTLWCKEHELDTALKMLYHKK